MISRDSFLHRIGSRSLSHANLLIGNGAAAVDELLAAVHRAYAISPFDKHVILPEADETTIPIAAIRALREKLSRKPHSSTHHLVIIPQAALLTPEAQSALLKILEEPVAPTLFFLVVSDEKLLLSTVTSRCQRIQIWASVRPDDGSEIIREIVTRPLAEQFALAEKLAKDPEILVTIDQWAVGLRTKLQAGDRGVSRMLRAILAAKEKLQATQVNRRLLLEDLFLSLKLSTMDQGSRRSG